MSPGIAVRRSVPLFLLFLIVGFSGAQDLPRQYVRVGVYQNPPKIYIDQTGQVTGFTAELLRLIARDYRWAIEFVPVAFNEGLSMVEQGELDLMTDVGYSDSRNERLLFTDRSIITSWATLYSKDNLRLDTFLDLDGLRVGGMKGDIHLDGESGFRALMDDFGIHVSLTEYDDYSQVLQAVDGGQIDVGVVNRLFGQRYGDDFGVQPSSIVFNPISIRYAAERTAKGEELVRDINFELQLLLDDTESDYYKLFNRYIMGIGDSVQSIPDWLKVLGAGLAGAVLILLAVTLAMKRKMVVRRQVEAELRRARTAAIEADNAKSTFLANMTHELRTPLNVIIGYIQILLKSTNLSDRELDNLRTMYRSGDHLLSLINDVLDISKLKTNKVTDTPAPLDIRDRIHRIETLLSAELSRKRLNLRVDIDESIPEIVVADQQKLKQILLNLVGNSIKFTPPNGHIEILGTAADDELLLRVKDTGIGIKPDMQRIIFNEFDQANSPGQSEGGTGLGLAISRTLARIMGGDLLLESSDRTGSVFLLRLPLVRTAESVEIEDQDEVIRVLPQGLTPPRILIADDQEENRNLLLALLRPVGFQVETASDGAETLERYGQFRPDLLILDIRMPKVNGIEALRRIKAGYADSCRTIVLTASTLEEQRREISEAGADEILLKPFNHNHLLIRISTLLGFDYDESPIETGSSPGGTSPVSGEGVSTAEIAEPLRVELEKAVKLGSKKDVLQLLSGEYEMPENVRSFIMSRVREFDFQTLRSWFSGESEHD